MRTSQSRLRTRLEDSGSIITIIIVITAAAGCGIAPGALSRWRARRLP